MHEIRRPALETGITENLSSRGVRVSGGVVRGVLSFARRRPLGAIGGAVCLFMILVAIAAPVLASHETHDIIGRNYEGPHISQGWNHWGTDQLGRDVYSRVLHGARTALLVGFGATIWGTTLGVVWGSIQGYYGGKWFDTVSQRLNETQMAIPGLVLAMVLLTIMPASVTTVVIAIGISYIPSGARAVRSLTLSVRERDYVHAARALGANTGRIIFRHVMPNTMSIYLVLLSLHVGGAIIAESSLSFLGLGAGPDIPTWGGMVSRGTRQALSGGVPWMAIIPGVAIAATVYGFNLFGDAMRDELDPRLRGSEKR